MKINKRQLKIAVNSAVSTNNITVYSMEVARPLRYFEHTVVGVFKRGVLAADILNDVMEKVHPELWNAACDLTPINKGGRAQCPACGECFFTERGNANTKQEIPVISEIDKDVLGQVESELEVRAGRLVSVYSTRAAAVLRYMQATETKFSISREAADLIEVGLSELYPVFFEAE